MCYHAEFRRSALKGAYTVKTPKLGNAETLLSWDGRPIHAPPPCVTTSNSVYSSATNGVCIHRRKPQKLGERGAPYSCVRGVVDPLRDILPTRVILQNLVVLGQTVRALLRRSMHLKNLTCGVQAFKVTQGHRNRHNTIRQL